MTHTAQHTVLIVEDDKFLSRAMRDKLVHAGFQVQVAFNGEEGLRAMTDAQPEVVLLDLMMPVKTGFDCLADIALSDDLRKIPVIVLSNLGQESDIKKAKDLGAVDYLVKSDNTIQEVVNRVKNHIAHRVSKSHT